MTLYTYTHNQCPYQVSTSYTLQFLRYSPDKLFSAGQAHLDTMGENNTPTALKGCGVNQKYLVPNNLIEESIPVLLLLEKYLIFRTDFCKEDKYMSVIFYIYFKCEREKNITI